MNITDPLSAYCQRRKGPVIESLDNFDEEDNQWVEAVVEGHHTPVFDQVKFRCDFPAWLGTLSRLDRRITLALAQSETTGRTAHRFHVQQSRASFT